MSATGDALAGLFLDEAGGDRARGSQTFARGFLAEWNVTTGENLVQVDIATYRNCLFLFGGELAVSTTVLVAFVSPGTPPIILARLGGF